MNVIQHPNCTEAIISDDGEKFVISVERELIAEVIGETKVCVVVHHENFEEEWPLDDESSSTNREHHGNDQKRGNESSSF